jgi:DNA-binding winged helix-turn-helix (wHTH) protein/TolB-like protein
MNREQKFYEFDEFRLDVGDKTLWRGQDKVYLPLKAVELLTLLLDNRGRTVTKEEILETLWQDTFVDENNLAVTVSTLRKVFGERKDENRFIETVPRRGYRFVAEARETKGSVILEKHTVAEITLEETETPHNRIGRRNRNLAIPGILILVLSGLLIYWGRSSPTEKTANGTSLAVAVLPLRNLTPAQDPEQLSLTLTDALITKLAGIKGLIVRPTSSILGFTENPPTPQLVQEKLKVENYLEGTIQRVENRLRISLQLVKTSDGSIVWAGNFDEAETDLLKLQDAISDQVVSALRFKLSPQEKEMLAKRGTENDEAFRLYLKGRYYWNKRTASDLQESVKLFKASIDQDPTFALAYSGLADTFALFSEYQVAPPAVTFPQAKAAAQKALEINPNLAEAHTTLAYALASYDWDFPEAEREYKKAIELNPNYPTARQWFGEFLTGLKRFDEAETQIKRARELDPLSPIIQMDIGLLLYYKRDFEASVRQYQTTINDNLTFPFVHFGLALAYEKQGKFDQAAAAEIEGWRLSGADPKTIGFLEQAYRNGGYKGFLQAQLAIHQEIAKTNYSPAFNQAFLYGRLGDPENSLKYLEKSFQERFRYTIYINGDPSFDFMRDDPRFQDLLRRLNLPQPVK